MDNSEKDIDDLFNDRFKEDEAAVSNRVWDNIKKTLPKESNEISSFWNFNKKIFFTVLTLFIIAGGSFFVFEKITNQPETQKLSNLKAKNAEQRTGNTEQRKKINTKDKTENSSLSESNTNKNASTENNENTIDDNSPVSKENKSTNAIKTNKENKQSGINSTSTENYSTNKENGNALAKNKKVSTSLTNDSNDSSTKNKSSVAKNNLNQAKKTTRNKPNATLSQNNSSNDKRNTDKTTSDRTKKSMPSVNLDKEQIPIVAGKPDDKIDLNSFSAENKKKEKFDTLNNSSVNDLKNATNSTVVSNAFSDSNGISKNEKTAPPIISKTNSDNKFVALNENNKKSDSTILTSTSIVAKNDTIQPDSLTKNIIIPDTLVSEKKKEKEKKNNSILSKLSFDLLLSPGTTGASASPNFTDSTSRQRVALKKSNSSNKTTLSGGLRVNYSVSERLNISVGIFYTNYSQSYTLNSHSQTSSAYVPDSSLVGSKQDTIGSDSLGHPILGPSHSIYNHFKSLKTTTTEYPGKTVTDHYTFISIPLTASYALVNKKIGVVCIGGVSTNILIKGVSHYINESFTDLVSNHSFTSINMGVTGGVGISYRFTKHLSFLVEPRVNYFLSNIDTSSSFIKQKPHSINVNAGLRFKF